MREESANGRRVYDRGVVLHRMICVLPLQVECVNAAIILPRATFRPPQTDFPVVTDMKLAQGLYLSHIVHQAEKEDIVDRLPSE